MKWQGAQWVRNARAWHVGESIRDGPCVTHSSLPAPMTSSLVSFQFMWSIMRIQSPRVGGITSFAVSCTSSRLHQSLRNASAGRAESGVAQNGQAHPTTSNMSSRQVLIFSWHPCTWNDHSSPVLAKVQRAVQLQQPLREEVDVTLQPRARQQLAEVLQRLCQLIQRHGVLLARAIGCVLITVSTLVVNPPVGHVATGVA